MYHVPIPFIGRGPERTHFVCLECRVVSKETFPNHFLLSRRLDFSRPCEIELLCYLSFIRLNVVPSLLLTLSSSFRFFFSCFYFVQYKYNKIFGCIYLYWILISFQELILTRFVEYWWMLFLLSPIYENLFVSRLPLRLSFHSEEPRKWILQFDPWELTHWNKMDIFWGQFQSSFIG